MFLFNLPVLLALAALYNGAQAVNDGEELNNYRPIHERPQCSMAFFFKDTAKTDARHATATLVNPSWVITGWWPFLGAKDIDFMTVRCGSLCLFEGGTSIRADGHYKILFKWDVDMQVALVRLTVPYYGLQSGTSDLAFINVPGYEPQGTNQLTGEINHQFIAGFQGMSVNWVGHRVRSMRTRHVDTKQCGLIYHATQTAIDGGYMLCYTEAGCVLSWWSWWPWAWKSCPSRITTEKYDVGAGVFPLGTNILTSVIQTHHNVKYNEKLPMGTNIQMIEVEIRREVRANSPDMYKDWPEFTPEGVQ